MKPALIFVTVILLLFAAVQTTQAYGTPQPGEPPAQVQSTPPSRDGGFPWLAVLVFGIAAGVTTYIKSRTPATIVTGSCCAPVIDEAKMERERRRIAEIEKSPPLS